MKLVIAEKPSVAQSISAVIGATARKDGYMEGKGYLVSWCVGHLVELASADCYNEKYAKWQYEDLPILPSNWKYVISKGKEKQMKIIGNLMKRSDVTEIIAATDAGREGELIFRLVYEKLSCKKPIKRLWISSMEETSIAEGFKNEKAIILPYNVRAYLQSNQATRQLYVTHIGYYPEAKYHFRERKAGANQNILIFCEKGKGWIIWGSKLH